MTSEARRIVSAVAGHRGRAANRARMTRQRARCERTERILTARLEELARALERSSAPNAEIAEQLGSASIATENAVALNLISAEAADEIWRDAAERHPELGPASRAA